VQDNRRAIEEAATLGTSVLVLDDATAAGVKLAVEPLHPMFCADRSAISTLQEANDLAERLPGIGDVVDAYHAALARSVHAAGYRGPIEVEVLNQAVWDMPGDEVLQRVLTWAGADASIAAWPLQKSSSPATSPS
jgi:hypothetical protein